MELAAKFLHIVGTAGKADVGLHLDEGGVAIRGTKVAGDVGGHIEMDGLRRARAVVRR